MKNAPLYRQFYPAFLIGYTGCIGKLNETRRIDIINLSYNVYRSSYPGVTTGLSFNIHSNTYYLNKEKQFIIFVTPDVELGTFLMFFLGPMSELHGSLGIGYTRLFSQKSTPMDGLLVSLQLDQIYNRRMPFLFAKFSYIFANTSIMGMHGIIKNTWLIDAGFHIPIIPRKKTKLKKLKRK